MCIICLLLKYCTYTTRTHTFILAVDAFVACGGKPDKSGFVRKETLVKIIKGDFGLTINIEEMINKLDVDGSGEIEFDEFKAILT